MTESIGDVSRTGLTGEQRVQLLSCRTVGTIALEHAELCTSLRAEYLDNPYALEEIDFNDPGSAYSRMLVDLYDALINNDPDTVSKIERHLDLIYPLHGSSL